jgi:predicted nucleic acid-binding protein
VGLILDFSILISAERAARPISELLDELRASAGGTDIMLSAVSVIELEHGLWRANTQSLPNAGGFIWTEFM